MQEHTQLTQRQINEDLLDTVLSTPRWWLPATLVAILVFLIGASAFGYMLNKGVGVTGLNLSLIHI